MDFAKLLRSFIPGFVGIGYVLRTEQNMRIHAFVTIGVVLAGWYFRLSAVEWIAVVLCIGGVTAAEAINTAVERLADRVTEEHDELVKHAKDTAAASVLLLSIAAVVVGAIVFLPKLITLFHDGS